MLPLRFVRVVGARGPDQGHGPWAQATWRADPSSSSGVLTFDVGHMALASPASFAQIWLEGLKSLRALLLAGPGHVLGPDSTLSSATSLKRKKLN